MSDAIQPMYALIYLLGVFLAAISQVLLKKAAMRPHNGISGLAGDPGLRHLCGLHPFKYSGL